jgi:hypothetical protein
VRLNNSQNFVLEDRPPRVVHVDHMSIEPKTATVAVKNVRKIQNESRPGVLIGRLLGEQDWAVHFRSRWDKQLTVPTSDLLPVLLQKGFFLQFPTGLNQVVRLSEITPIVLIGAKGENFLAAGGEA